MRKFSGYILLLFMIASPAIVLSKPGKRSGNGTRLHFGPAYGFYTLNTKHARNPVQRMSMSAGFRRELRVGREYKSYILIGVDYLLHGVNFRSYYFKPDTLKLYDKTFSYNYSLYIHELSLPIQYKYLFKREDNSLFSPYVIAAYQLRFLLPADLKIHRDGELVKTDQPELKFRHPLIDNKMNAGVSLGVGWQKNNLTASRGSFFIELNFRYGFSQYYLETDYAPSALYINSTHLVLQLGLKF